MCIRDRVRAVEKLGRGTKKFIDAQDEDGKEESLDATIDMIQAGGNLIPGGPLFAQLANVGEATLGFTSSNLTDEGRRARFKGRFNKYKKSLTELLGPTTNKETGETDKDIQQQNGTPRQLTCSRPWRPWKLTRSSSSPRNCLFPRPCGRRSSSGF